MNGGGLSNATRFTCGNAKQTGKNRTGHTSEGGANRRHGAWAAWPVRHTGLSRSWSFLGQSVQIASARNISYCDAGIRSLTK